MGKQALVVNTQDYKNLVASFNKNEFVSDIDAGENIYVNFLSPEMLTLESRLVERSICETDTSTLQLIPYIVLAMLEKEDDMYPDPVNPNTRFFIYTRGEKGNENRLHGKCSIGLGGHVEEEPNETLTLKHVLYNAVVRELEEEVGLVLNKELDENFGFDYLVYNNDVNNPVNQVHLGLFITLFVNPNDLTKREEGVITKGQWCTFEEIRELAKSNVELETWSEIYLSSLGKYIADDDNFNVMK